MTDKENDWRLDSLEISFQKWGDDKGKYTGKIKYQNGEQESFEFRIRPHVANKYIDLIAGDIVMAADSLAERLVASLQLRERQITPPDNNE